jgi:uncharacterized protein
MTVSGVPKRRCLRDSCDDAIRSFTSSEMDMSEANKATVLKFLDRMCEGDVAAMKSMMTPDIKAYAMGNSVLSGVRDYNAIVATAGAFPLVMKSGLNPKVISVTAEADRVALEWEGNAELVNGKKYCNQYLMLFTVRDGKVSCMKEYFCTALANDTLGPILLAAEGKQ